MIYPWKFSKAGPMCPIPGLLPPPNTKAATAWSAAPPLVSPPLFPLINQHHPASSSPLLVSKMVELKSTSPASRCLISPRPYKRHRTHPIIPRNNLSHSTSFLSVLSHLPARAGRRCSPFTFAGLTSLSHRPMKSSVRCPIVSSTYSSAHGELLYLTRPVSSRSGEPWLPSLLWSHGGPWAPPVLEIVDSVYGLFNTKTIWLSD
jgi:hypothetical protein